MKFPLTQKAHYKYLSQKIFGSDRIFLWEMVRGYRHQIIKTERHMTNTMIQVKFISTLLHKNYPIAQWLKAIHYYLTIPVGQDPSMAQQSPLSQGLLRGCNQGVVQSWDRIGKLNWRKMVLQTHDCCHVQLLSGCGPEATPPPATGVSPTCTISAHKPPRHLGLLAGQKSQSL